jgi:hypothetical protein
MGDPVGQASSSRSGVPALLMAALLMAAAPASAGDPTGDYGDAPDGAGGFFPTSFATASSRVGGPGVHHLTTGLEMLGPSVSAEAGVSDPLDPDGVPNLVDADSDDGVLSLLVLPAGAVFGVPMVQPTLAVTFSVAPGAPNVTRYLNVLLDVNGDGMWMDTGASKEWVLINHEVDTLPGTAESIMIALDVVLPTLAFLPPGPMYMRCTFSRTPISPLVHAATGGWDGSGAFAFGETEDVDYKLLATMPGPSCVFNVVCNPRAVLALHGGSFQICIDVTVAGPPGCMYNCVGTQLNDPGPLMGLFATNGLGPNDTIDTSDCDGDDGGGPGLSTRCVTITTEEHDIGLIQSFSITFRLQGFLGGAKVWGATKTCGALVLHDPPDWVVEELDIIPGLPPLGTPIAVGPPGDPVAWVVFAEEQPVEGSITIARGASLLPGTPAGTLPTSFLVDVSLDGGAQTCIDQLWLAGYTDAEVAAAAAAEVQLRPLGSRPTLGYTDAGAELAALGSNTVVDTFGNVVRIEQPAEVGLVTLDLDQPVIWTDMANGLGGTLGVPALAGSGLPSGGQPVAITMTGALPLVPAFFVLGFTKLDASFKGGVLSPMPDVVVGGLPVGPTGALTIPTIWPPGVPPGFPMYSQLWFSDPGAPKGLAATNGLAVISQP